MIDTSNTGRLRELNDEFRRSLAGGTLVMTAGIIALGAQRQRQILAAIAAFAAFDADNDPHNEHDFGALTVDGERLFWKFDYYDPSRSRHSDDPADASLTARVMTLMLAEEY